MHRTKSSTQRVTARLFKPSIKTIAFQRVTMAHKDIVHLFYLYTISSVQNFIELLKCAEMITIVKLGAGNKEETSVNTAL